MTGSLERQSGLSLRSGIIEYMHDGLSNVSVDTEVRLQYCGGKFSVEKILESGFAELSRDDQDCVLGLYAANGNDRYEMRLFLGSTGYLRDVRFYSFDMSSEIETIRSVYRGSMESVKFGVDLLARCIIEQPPGTAFEDFERVRDGFQVVERYASESESVKLCIIWAARLDHWMTAHHPTAARLVVAAARHPVFCASGMAMAQAAYDAMRLGMDGEAKVIIEAALLLHTDDDDPLYWNLLGCAFDKMRSPEWALGCFLESLEADHVCEYAINNAWLVGKDLVAGKLYEKEFKETLELIDRLMRFTQGVEDDSRAIMMASSGLCCEGLGLLEEAGDRYKIALDISADCLVARLGSNRILSENVEERMRQLELQLACFPQIPHERGIDGQAPIKFIEGYSHGDHWDAVTSGAEEFIPSYLPLAVEKGEVRGTAAYDPAHRVNGSADAAFLIAYPPTGEIVGGNLVMKTPQHESLALSSSYPYAIKGESVRLEVVSLEEWANGIEGSVIVKRGGGGVLTFFDPFFFENKKIYSTSHEYEFFVYGFAYQISKSEEIVYKMSSGAGYELERMRCQEEGNPMAEGDTYDVVLGGNSTLLMDLSKYPGEYNFFLPVEMVSRTEFLGEEVLVIASHINDDKRNIPINIYAAKRLLKEEVTVGDMIMGYLWLQGLLISKEGVFAKSHLCEDEDEGFRFGKISYSKQESESMDNEFRELVPRIIGGIDSVRKFASLPFRVGDEPDYVVEGQSGKRCFLYCIHFDMKMSKWEDALNEKEQITNAPWIASRFSPLFIVGVGYTKIGEGSAFKYFGWDSFENFLEDESGSTSSSR